MDELHDAVSDARFVVLAVPLTDETHHLVDAETLEAMDDTAYLINVARGGVVDRQALVWTLRHDDVAGAALDVFETEPLPESSPLWDFEDVIVTPHSAGVTKHYFRDVAAIVRENGRRARADEPLVNRVV
jgi:D-2-hydroxyacid dehydrogenase (NADP+)